MERSSFLVRNVGFRDQPGKGRRFALLNIPNYLFRPSHRRSPASGHKHSSASEGFEDSSTSPPRSVQSRSPFINRSRIDRSSFLRSALTSGYVISSPLRVSRMICETINRAFSLSSAGTTYQGAFQVLVAPRHFSQAFIYCFQNFLSTMSALLNFQFFPDSSMRAKKRLRFSSLER